MAQLEDEPDEPDERAGPSGASDELALLHKEVARLGRVQAHQREQFLVLQAALNSVHEAIKGKVEVDYPESLKPLTFLDNPRGDVLFLAFSGLNLASGIPQFEFQRSLSEHGAPGYFVKDFHQSWYQQGLLGLTDDAAGTAQYLRKLIAPYGDRELVTVGASSGGYAAILFGCLLGASRVLAFSPQTRVVGRVIKHYAALDTPDPAAILKRRDWLDLRKFLERSAHRPQITIYYGRKHRLDAKQAKRLEGMDGVRLIAVEGAGGHSVTPVLKRRGELQAALSELLGAGPQP